MVLVSWICTLEVYFYMCFSFEQLLTFTNDLHGQEGGTEVSWNMWICWYQLWPLNFRKYASILLWQVSCSCCVKVFIIVEYLLPGFLLFMILSLHWVKFISSCNWNNCNSTFNRLSFMHFSLNASVWEWYVLYARRVNIQDWRRSVTDTKW